MRFVAPIALFCLLGLPLSGLAASPKQPVIPPGLHARVITLSPFERKALVLMVATDVEHRQESMSHEGQTDARATMATVARQYQRLGKLANDIGWSDVSALYMKMSDAAAKSAGQSISAQEFDSVFGQADQRYRATMRQFLDAHLAEFRKPPRPELLSLQSDLTNWVTSSSS